MKKIVFALAMLSLTLICLQSCSSGITVCECLKDDGSHKEECDELGNSMTNEELTDAMNECN